VPAVLLSGAHGRVRRFRRKEALRATRARRPDLLAAAALTPEDERLLREIEDDERACGSGALDKRPVVIHK
jgi:tRNA (guanine37-N1)-methyltransferase